MTEEQKYAILFSATILAARKLADIGDKPCPAREACIEDVIRHAERIQAKDRSALASGIRFPLMQCLLSCATVAFLDIQPQKTKGLAVRQQAPRESRNVAAVAVSSATLPDFLT